MTASMSSDLPLIIKETKFYLNVLTFLCLELPLSTFYPLLYTLLSSTMLTIAVVLFAMQLAVLSTPVAQEAGRIDIPLTRRDVPQRDLVDPQHLQELLISATL